MRTFESDYQFVSTTQYIQAAEAVGRLASHHVDGRDLVLRLGVFPVLCAQISDSTPPALLNTITYVFLPHPLSY